MIAHFPTKLHVICVDPQSSNPVAAAASRCQTVAMHSYQVSALSSLWHINSRLKLVRCAQLAVEPIIAISNLQPASPVRHNADMGAIKRVQAAVAGCTNIKAMFTETVHILAA